MIGGIRTESMTINNETVDVTDKDGNGWRELLEGAGITSMSLKGSGVVSDNAVLPTTLWQPSWPILMLYSKLRAA